MAVSNTLSSVIPLIFAQGLGALRHNAVMPRLVNFDYADKVAEKGQVINIPIPSAITATNVVPAAYAPDSGNVAPTTAQIPLNSWQETAFTLSEKELAQVVSGVVPIQLSAAVEGLAFAINASILSLYTGVYGFVGTPGTTPFASDFTAATSARKVLAQQLCPTNNRRMVIDPNAEANATALPAFYSQYITGQTNVIQEGVIGHKLGLDWHMDQQMPTQTAGTLTGTVTANGAQAAGLTSISIATAGSSSFAPNVGDIIMFSGDSQTYVISAGTALGASTNGLFTIAPAKVVALAGGETVTIKASHLVNLCFHRDAFGFASRPLSNDRDLRADKGDTEMSMTDPVSGLALRLSVRQEYHRTRWAFDTLWGVGVVRPQLAVRVAG